MNEAQRRVGALLSACLDMVKGIVGTPFAVTLFCRHRSGPAHILMGDDKTPILIAALEELERFGQRLVDEDGEVEEYVPATDRMAEMLRECAAIFRGNAVMSHEENAKIAGRIEAMLRQMSFDECDHPNATPVLGKVCTYECPDCEIEFTRTKPSEIVHMPDMRDGQ